MNESFTSRIKAELEEITAAGLFKKERIITSEQGPEITVNGATVLNFCANNYLGLSSHPKVIEAAHKAIDTHVQKISNPQGGECYWVLNSDKEKKGLFEVQRIFFC